MAYITKEKIEEILNKADIVDIISKYVPLTQKGKNFIGVCPFHDDSNPSMSVSKDKHMYNCFACGNKGNVFKFLMEFENIPFTKAVSKVADMVGIDGVETTTNYVNQDLLNIYDLAQKYYLNLLNTKEGITAKNYLIKRNINENIIKEFGIGYAPREREILTNILLKKYKEKDILKTGLVYKNDYGYSDIFIDRIMFPLCDLKGNVVGYSGRIYDDSLKDKYSKYTNTGETEIFIKGNLLYNYHRAKNPARLENKIIIMEGFMDVIRASTINIKNVVASMGTAVTTKQANLLKSLAKEIILCFDGDLAGAKATMALSDELLKQGITPKVVRLEENLDPDEYILKYGEDKFKEKINNPISIMDFKLNYLKKDANLDSSVDMAKYVNNVIKELNKISDDVLREVTIKKVSKESGLDENLIRSKLTNVIIELPKPIKKKVIKYDKYEKAQRYLLYYMLKYGDVITLYDKNSSYFPVDKYRQLARTIDNFYNKNKYIDVSDLAEYVNYDDDIINTISEIENQNLKEKYLDGEIEDYIKIIREYTVKNEIKRLQSIMKKETITEKKVKIAEEILELRKEEENV